MGVAALAERFGTPLLVIDLDVLDENIARVAAAARAFNVEVSYAGKAFLCVALARYLHAAGIGIDVCSLGEYETARLAGVPASAITLHGCAKNDAELSFVTSGAVGRSVVDGIEELQRTLDRATQLAPAPLLLRLNSGVEAPTHLAVRTAGEASKFGIAPEDESRALALLIDAAKRVRFLGLHGHLGSQVDEPNAFVAHGSALMEAAVRFTAAGMRVSTIVLGGGFVTDPRPMLASCIAAMNALATRSGLALPSIGIEPGRAIVASAGTTYVRIHAIKTNKERRIAICDGGLFENPRPALYGAYHRAHSIEQPNAELLPTLLCGKSCESDELGMMQLPATLRVGELVAIEQTGAYTASMASNYNRFTRPPVVAVRGRDATLWMRAETTQEVLARDVDA